MDQFLCFDGASFDPKGTVEKGNWAELGTGSDAVTHAPQCPRSAARKMKRSLHIMIAATALLLGGNPLSLCAGVQESAADLQQSITATVELVRNSFSVEVFAQPTRRQDQPPDCILTNAEEIGRLADAFILLDPAEPPVPPCAYPNRIRYCSQDQVVSVSFCDDFLLLASSNQRSALANRHYYRTPPDLKRIYHTYWLRYRPPPDVRLMGLSKTKDSETEVLLQTRDGLRPHKIGDTIDGFRLVQIDEAHSKVLLRCVESGREVWIK
jgi:hypothetical protein